MLATIADTCGVSLGGYSTDELRRLFQGQFLLPLLPIMENHAMFCRSAIPMLPDERLKYGLARLEAEAPLPRRLQGLVELFEKSRKDQEAATQQATSRIRDLQQILTERKLYICFFERARDMSGYEVAEVHGAPRLGSVNGYHLLNQLVMACQGVVELFQGRVGCAAYDSRIVCAIFCAGVAWDIRRYHKAAQTRDEGEPRLRNNIASYQSIVKQQRVLAAEAANYE